MGRKRSKTSGKAESGCSAFVGNPAKGSPLGSFVLLRSDGAVAMIQVPK